MQKMDQPYDRQVILPERRVIPAFHDEKNPQDVFFPCYPITVVAIPGEWCARGNRACAICWQRSVEAKEVITTSAAFSKKNQKNSKDGG